MRPRRLRTKTFRKCIRHSLPVPDGMNPGPAVVTDCKTEAAQTDRLWRLEPQAVVGASFRIRSMPGDHCLRRAGETVVTKPFMEVANLEELWELNAQRVGDEVEWIFQEYDETKRCLTAVPGAAGSTVVLTLDPSCDARSRWTN